MKSASLNLEHVQDNAEVKSLDPIKWPQWLENFVDTYQKLSTENLSLIFSIYHDEVVFIDPLHKVEGIVDLHKYFQGLYANLSQCDFVIDDVIINGEQAALYWQMTYKHPRLNSGEEVIVSGTSRIIAKDNSIIYHRDYLDIGTMLYEQLPVIGRVVKWIKAKAVN
jgi:hypothetical protein